MVSTTNLLAYYKLDEASGTFTDSHNSYDLTNTGVTYGNTGKLNDAAGFDNGTSDKLRNTSIPNTAKAVNMWVNLSTQENFDTLFTLNDGTEEFTIYYSNGWVASNWNGSTAAATTSNTTDWTGGWHMFTYVDNGSTIKFYVDGVEEGSVSSQSNTFTTLTLTIGNHNSLSRAPDGLIDEVSVWSSLSTSDISDLYNSGSGLAYPFTSDVTINLASALSLSTTQEAPTILLNIASSGALSLSASLLDATIPSTDDATVVAGTIDPTKTKGTSEIATNYPNTEGLVLGSTKIHGRKMFLEPTGINGKKSTVFAKQKYGIY